jgi:hypothetical protein
MHETSGTGKTVSVDKPGDDHEIRKTTQMKSEVQM